MIRTYKSVRSTFEERTMYREVKAVISLSVSWMTLKYCTSTTEPGRDKSTSRCTNIPVWQHVMAPRIPRIYPFVFFLSLVSFSLSCQLPSKENPHIDHVVEGERAPTHTSSRSRCVTRRRPLFLFTALASPMEWICTFGKSPCAVCVVQ